MSAKNFKNIKRGKSSDLSDVEELLAQLDELIPQFVGSPIFKRDIFDKSNEDDYTSTLIKYFVNQDPNSRFSFESQTPLPKKRRMDIGVYVKTDSEHYILNIEAKFLPPKDYVTGEYAAIKRFKCGQHGLSNRNPAKAKLLQENVVVAYSKSGTFNQHLTKINNKIFKLAALATPDKFGLTWDESEQLQKINFNSTAKLKSTHSRVDDSEVVLHHFWVNV